MVPVVSSPEVAEHQVGQVEEGNQQKQEKELWQQQSQCVAGKAEALRVEQLEITADVPSLEIGVDGKQLLYIL